MFKRIVLLAFVSMFLLSVVFGVRFIRPVMAKPDVIRVPYDYLTIQAAVNAASPGDIVLVASGTYYEHVTVNKSLALIGEDRSSTIIDGNGTDTVTRITASNVSINGFTVQNGGISLMMNSGIFIGPGSSGNTISGNIITSNYWFGIWLNNTSGNTIIDNQMSNNGHGLPLGGGGGIALIGSNGNVIRDNVMTSNVFGVDLGWSSNNTIVGNMMSNNPTDFSLTHSEGNLVSNNIITSYKGEGVRLGSSSGNTIMSNIICGSYHGVRLDYSGGNTILDNTIYGGRKGIMLDHASNNNTIVGNTLSSNYKGIVLDYVRNNTIYHNNLIDNTEHVHHIGTPLSSNTWDNGAGEGNYWSDYEGVDLDGDGIGDTFLPHSGVDYHPLIIPWGPIPVIWDGVVYPVALLGNSTVSAFDFKQPLKQINFNVNGPPGTIGFCNVTIPKALLRANETHPWEVYLNGSPINCTSTENATHTFIYFTYNQNTYKVKIIGTWVVPEFPTAMILPLLLIITLIVAILAKKNASSSSYKEEKG